MWMRPKVIYALCSLHSLNAEFFKLPLVPELHDQCAVDGVLSSQLNDSGRACVVTAAQHTFVSATNTNARTVAIPPNGLRACAQPRVRYYAEGGASYTPQMKAWGVPRRERCVRARVHAYGSAAHNAHLVETKHKRHALAGVRLVGHRGEEAAHLQLWSLGWGPWYESATRPWSAVRGERES